MFVYLLFLLKVIFRSTKQWFGRVDGKVLEDSLNALNQVTMIPPQSKRLVSMMSQRKVRDDIYNRIQR
eukprot:Awhi_evm1s9043